MVPLRNQSTVFRKETTAALHLHHKKIFENHNMLHRQSIDMIPRGPTYGQALHFGTYLI